MTIDLTHRPARILLLSASAGNGHTRAARALEQAFRARAPEAEIRHLDMLDLAPRWLRFVARNVYEFMVDHAPEMWGRLYHHHDRKRTRRHYAWRRLSNRSAGERLFDAIAAFQPDLIVGTHFLHHALLKGNERRLPAGCRLALVVTDNDAHRCWQYPEVDQYYLYSDDVVAAFAERGLPRERLMATGMPIEARFYRHVEKAPVYARYGFDPTRPTCTLIKGLARWAWLHRDSAVERLLHALREANVLLVVGRDDAALAAHLRERFGAAHPRLHVACFVENVEEVLTITDLAVTKAGGSITAELLAKQVPVLVMGTIPGQEEKNRDLLVRHGLGREVSELHDLVNSIEALFEHREDLEAMHRRYARHARPDPAEIIARRELALLDARLAAGTPTAEAVSDLPAGAAVSAA